MNKKEFQQLRKLWYKKLKDSGFIDIESEITNGGMKIGKVFNPQKAIYSEAYYFTLALDHFVNNIPPTLKIPEDIILFLDDLRFTGKMSISQKNTNITIYRVRYWMKLLRPIIIKQWELSLNEYEEEGFTEGCFSEEQPETNNIKRFRRPESNSPTKIIIKRRN